MFNNFKKGIFSAGILLYFSAFIIFNSCFYGSIQGLKSGYQSKSDSIIVMFDKELYDIKELDKNIIYAIDAKSLKEAIASYNHTLIYEWSPNCHSDVCIPLEIVQDYCNLNNIELIVLIEYYDDKILNYMDKVENPLFSINHLYYKTNYVNKYQEYFWKDLLRSAYDKNTSWHRYKHFIKGTFVKSEQRFLN